MPLPPQTHTHIHTHTIHRTRRRHSLSTSVLASWYFRLPSQSYRNDLTQIFLNMETLTKYPQNWNHSIFKASPPPSGPHIFVPWASTLRYLSLVLDSKCLHTQHLHTVANKATVVLCNFLPLVTANSTLTQSNKLTTYKLLIRSILTYVAPVCSSTCPSTHLRLQVTHSKCLRIIGNYPRPNPTTHWHDSLNTEHKPFIIHRSTNKFLSTVHPTPNPCSNKSGSTL